MGEIRVDPRLPPLSMPGSSSPCPPSVVFSLCISVTRASGRPPPANPHPALNLTPCVLLPPVKRSSPYVNQ